MERLYSIVARDLLEADSRTTPHPIPVLIFSVLCGIVFVGLFRWGGRFGLQMPMFAKEGFTENLTFLLDLWAGILCGLAALRTSRRRADIHDTLIVTGYWICAGLLFLVAMDEIAWGQQLVTFKTPDAWKELNYQQETTLHNLADRDALTRAWKIVAAAFAVGAIMLMSAAEITGNKVLRYVAPHPSLAPLALLTAYAGVRVHPELAEVLIAVFFTFYGYRIYVASPPGCRARRHAT